MLSSAGIPVVGTEFVSIGGGLGSFAVVDYLRIAGLGVSKIKILSNQSRPHEKFAALGKISQLTLDDRLRSESQSTINNIWGWPGYALIEAIVERRLTPLWKVVTEPILSEYFTPKIRTVLVGVEREAARIGWNLMLDRCWVKVVRRRADGGYFVLTQLLDVKEDKMVAYRCSHVHIALGHPGPRLLPEILAFRERHGDSQQVVNVYEPHEYIYEHLSRSPGRVVVRGAGIAASRILERLINDRDKFGAQTEIFHIMRNYIPGAKGPLLFRRPGGHGFAYQPFSFPRAAGGGQFRQRTLALSGDERARFITSIGGTTTAWRRSWQRQLARGRREGWYRIQRGVLTDIDRNPSGRLTMAIAHEDCRWQVDADFLIDATGLEARIRQHTLLADMLDHGNAGTNALGGLDVEANFELHGARSGKGRIYASGAATIGCALAPVDSFWGLMHAAMEVCDDLADQGVCEFPGTLHSISQWWRWMRNQKP